MRYLLFVLCIFYFVYIYMYIIFIYYIRLYIFILLLKLYWIVFYSTLFCDLFHVYTLQYETFYYCFIESLYFEHYVCEI
jgi:hypothetical protein